MVYKKINYLNIFFTKEYIDEFNKWKNILIINLYKNLI